jgi:branched-chain amino acid transport system ATP-binding protein
VSLLEVRDLTAGYGAVTVLHGVSFDVGDSEAVALIGANAAGKTTLLRTLMGIVPARGGSVRFGGAELTRLRPHEVVPLGIAQVAEGRQLFPEMSVRENLELGAMARADAWAHRADTLERVCAVFPRVGERLEQSAGTMSGGEQQQVAIARALMARPRLLLVDEPSAGLAPVLVQAVFRALRDVHSDGVAVLLVEQNVPLSLRLAQRGYVIELGRVVLELGGMASADAWAHRADTLEGTGERLLADPHVKEAYLGR